MPIRGRLDKSTLKIGDELSAEQRKAVVDSSLTPDQIIANLDGLNEEVIESYDQPDGFQQLPPTVPTVEETVVQMSTEDDFMAGLKDLEAEINAAAPKVVEQPTEEEPALSVEEQMEEKVKDLLAASEGGPGPQQIAAWKQVHGENGVYATGLGDGDVYVFTFLRRKQWQKLQEMMQKAGDKEVIQQQDLEGRLKETVLTHCVLWPRPLDTTFFYNSRAGVVDSIYQAILMNSYFYNPQQIMLLTTQL